MTAKAKSMSVPAGRPAGRPTSNVPAGPHLTLVAGGHPHRMPVGVDEHQEELVRLVRRAPRDVQLERQRHRGQDRPGDRPAAAEDVELAVDLVRRVGEHHGHAHGLTVCESPAAHRRGSGAPTMTIEGVIGAIFIGLIIGALGRLVVPGRQRIPIWMTIAVGIVAALARLGHRRTDARHRRGRLGRARRPGGPGRCRCRARGLDPRQATLPADRPLTRDQRDIGSGRNWI